MKRLLLLLSIVVISYNQSEAQTIVVLTSDGKLFDIAPSAPGTTTSPVSITGITPGQAVAGIDYRPNTGELYALGYNALLPVANAQLYTVNKSTGAATAVGSIISLNLGTGSIGFDFNPAVDRIRVVGENRKNYRLHPVTGAIVATDADLSYATTDANNGATPAVGACAYTNSYIGSEVTTLYDYDQNLNILATQVPPNNGTLNTIGSSGISVNSMSPSIGMDIYFDPATKTNMAFLNANTGSGNTDNLYMLNLTTGTATMMGLIGAGFDVKEIAVQIDRNVPATYSGQLLYGLTKTNGNLIKFSSDNPSLIRELLPISGLTSGQVIVGMDVRPADLGLYALGYNASTREYQLYSINTTTGAATVVNATPGIIQLGVNEKIGFDFNPVADRIRVTSTNDSNYRLHPATGAIAAMDTMLSYKVGDVNFGKNPYLSSLAYINSYRNTASTALYGIDDSLNVFAGIAPPNQGYINTVMSGIASFNLADLSNDMDFFYDSTSAMNIGYLSANINASMNDGLYTITTGGATTSVGSIGLGIQVSDIAAQLSYTNTIIQGIAQVEKKELFRVFPNPVQNELNISFLTATDKNTSLIVTDVTGRVMQRYEVAKGVYRAVVNVGDLSNGIYFISLPERESKAIRFLKQ